MLRTKGAGLFVWRDQTSIAHRHIWWKRGQHPASLCDKRFTFAYIFAAVEPGTDNAFAQVMSYADTEAMQVFPDRFAETIAADKHTVMILDQPGWHGSTDLPRKVRCCSAYSFLLPSGDIAAPAAVNTPRP